VTLDLATAQLLFGVKFGNKDSTLILIKDNKFVAILFFDFFQELF